MSDRIIRFPLRSMVAVVVCKERDQAGWLVLRGTAGWLHAEPSAAIAYAVWLAHNTGLRRIVIRNWGRA